MTLSNICALFMIYLNLLTCQYQLLLSVKMGPSLPTCYRFPKFNQTIDFDQCKMCIFEGCYYVHVDIPINLLA